jgi:3-methyladenine DNA glycosylase/8-oxoguanine DNA glycosylase
VWRPDWPCAPYEIVRPIRRGAGDPSSQREPDGTLWRAVVTPEGPVTLRIAARPAEAAIELEAWGSGADWQLEHAPALLGAEDDVSDFRPTDPRVREAWSRDPHWRVTKSRLVLEALVASCLEQKVTGQEAWTGWRRLLRRFGDDAPGPGTERGMKMLPTARALQQVPSWEWLRCHVDGARSRPIVRAARVADSLQRTVDLPAPEAERALRSLPGVGEWTAAEVRQRAHGDADAVSFGDYHIATHVGWAMTGEAMTDEEMRAWLEPERPHRYRIQHVVTTRFPGRPRRGPRMAPRGHLPR